MFRKKGRARAEDAAADNEDAAAQTADAEAVDEAADAAPDQPAHAPLDSSEVEDTSGYLDLGGLLLRPIPGVSIRLDAEPKTKRIIAVTVLRDGASVQLRAFAAPRSGGMWDENRASILEQVAAQGGIVEEVSGVYGPELHAQLRVQKQDGSPGPTRYVRFVGVEGPRWLLHAVFTTESRAEDRWEPLEEVLGAVVVNRGDEAMPAGAMLALRPPEQAISAPTAAPAAPGLDQVDPKDRITEVR